MAICFFGAIRFGRALGTGEFSKRNIEEDIWKSKLRGKERARYGGATFNLGAVTKIRMEAHPGAPPSLLPKSD